MNSPIYRPDRWGSLPPPVRAFCFWTAWIRIVAASPQGGSSNDASHSSPLLSIAFLPSVAKIHVEQSATNLELAQSTLNPQPIVSKPSTPLQGATISKALPLFGSAPIPSTTAAPLFPSAPVPLFPSAPALGPSTGSDASTVSTGGLKSTDVPLMPIPHPSVSSGDPDGHHEVTEPNFTATAPCRGCSPVIEISVTGFDHPNNAIWPSSPAAEHLGDITSNPPTPPKATITAGGSPLTVSQAPAGTNFVISGPGVAQTVAPGHTITISNTPIAVQTSAGRPEVVVGGNTIVPFVANHAEAANAQITPGPILSPLTIAGQIITANAANQFVVGSQTLIPGGPAITVSGTTISLLPSATAVVINGVTSTIAQAYGGIFTSTTPALLTINNQIYTANAAGFYVLGPGTTLIPGGPAITVSGTVISLQPGGTAAVIAGSTSAMQPATTIVTMTGTDRGSAGHGISQGTTPINFATKTSHAGASSLKGSVAVLGYYGWFEGFFSLAVLIMGWLAVWL